MRSDLRIQHLRGSVDDIDDTPLASGVLLARRALTVCLRIPLPRGWMIITSLAQRPGLTESHLSRTRLAVSLRGAPRVRRAFSYHSYRSPFIARVLVRRCGLPRPGIKKPFTAQGRRIVDRVSAAPQRYAG